MTPWVRQYAVYMAGRGRRLTPQQQSVANIVVTGPRTFAAADVAARVIVGVSRATVYRTLAQLTDTSMLRRVRLGGQELLLVVREDV